MDCHLSILNLFKKFQITTIKYINKSKKGDRLS